MSKERIDDEEIDENIFDINVFEIMEPPVMLNELYSQKVDYQTKSQGIAGYLNKNNDTKQIQEEIKIQTNRSNDEQR